MPRYNIYIRKQDNDKWLSITNKPAFLSKAINAYINKNDKNK